MTLNNCLAFFFVGKNWSAFLFLFHNTSRCQTLEKMHATVLKLSVSKATTTLACITGLIFEVFQASMIGEGEARGEAARLENAYKNTYFAGYSFT